MAINYTKEYWSKSQSDTSWELSTFTERRNSVINYLSAQRKIARSVNSVGNYQEMLAGKKAWADKVISKQEKSKQEFDLLKKNNDADISDIKDIEEYNTITKEVDLQSQIEYIQMYYDSYMLNSNSDAQWRLGNLQGGLKEVRITDNTFGEVINGSVQTRSNMSYMYDWNYITEQGFSGRTQHFYSSLGFPPYKFGPNVPLGKKTDKMSKILLTNPNPTFDQDKFTVNREDITIRDIGMKSLSDWINYLQWTVEGATGIVSTYLTEWDLSVYIQEGLMLPKINGGPMDIYLNYRIRQDNPLADQSANEYLDDRALVFNACGSAVSKLYFDCTKNWRPSDYPLSAWWMPYLKDRDWKLAGLDINGIPTGIPYMSFYDDLVVNYAYDSQKDLRDIFKHQDYIGLMARAANTMNLPYWSIFYSSESDGSTNIDIKMKSLFDQVAGADAGVSSAAGKDLNYLKMVSRREAIMNGGYYGGPSAVDQNGGMYGRTMIDNLMCEDSEDQSEKTLSSLTAATSSYGEENSPNYSNKTTESPAKNSVNSNKKDASQMSKMVGINRLSPALYGGPHGSDYSPNNLRDYFKKDSLVTYQVPKIGYTELSTENEVPRDVSSDIEEGKYVFSPTKALSYIKEGAYSYRKKLVYCKDWITQTFEGTITFNPWTLKFDAVLPNNYAGSAIIYNTNKITYKTKVYNTRKLLLQMDMPWWVFIAVSALTDYGSEVYIKVPVCEGKYIGFCEKTGKFYDMQDFPDLKWKITAHNFLHYSTKTGKNEALFNGVNSHQQGPITDDSFKEVIKNAAYVLTCNSVADEEAIKYQLVQYNKGLTDSPVYLYFCGCDDLSERYTKGPSYIFKAPVYLRYYENVIEFYRKVFGFTVSAGISITYMPYLYVDLSATTEYFDLSVPTTKIIRGSTENLPAHMVQIYGTNNMTYSPVQKLKTGLTHTMTAFYDRRNAGGGLFGHLFGGNASAINDGVGTPIWSSTAELGIEGIGILSGWQGIDTSVENIETLYGTYAVRKYIVRSQDNINNTPLRQLPLHSVGRTNTISLPFPDMPPHISYMIDFGHDIYQGHATRYLDKALNDTINNICTTIYFKLYGKEDTVKLSIDEPVKNFVSYCQTELNYLKLTKDIFATLNFENIRKVMLNNVDACILKAAGLKKIDDGQFEKVKPDRVHILYNYWIEKAIELFYEKKNFATKRSKINERYDYLISSLESTIKVVTKILEKEPLDWTYNDWKTLMGQIYIQQENIVKNEIDEFFFAYLNILYCYRLYFIGKRFNKEDGTMWAMRQLESTIDLVHTNLDPAKSPSELNDKDKDIYNVVFYELQNTLDTKRAVIIDETHPPLQVDKVYRIYIKVQYAKESDYKKWLAYRDDSNNSPKAREVIRLNVDGETRYAFKPTDGLYQFRSQEYDNNIKNEEWNEEHKDQTPKEVKDYINCTFNVEWKPVKGKTPIRWNVFGSVNIDNLLEYSHESISAQDLICLSEEGADFWTVTIPAGLWPNKELYKKRLYIKLVSENLDVYNDVYTVVLGPFANSVSPIRSYNNMMLERLKDEVSFLKQ